MFWRILGKLFRASRWRLVVAVLAVASGAAVTSALINLQLDAERKLTREFRSLGANVVVTPAHSGAAGENDPPLADSAALDRLAPIVTSSPQVVAAAPYLYIVGHATPPDGGSAGTAQSVIVAGTWLDQVKKMSSWWKVDGAWIESRDDMTRCLVGQNAARQLGISPGSTLELHYGDHSAKLTVAGITSAGGTEDNQVFVNLLTAQRLAGLEGRIGVIQISVAGAPSVIEGFVGRLAAALPGFEVRPVRQLAEAEGNLLRRIRVLILFTVILILVLTALCVLATMAALAMERRRDVGLMKALGGSVQRVVRLFLVEAASLGLIGGLIGYAGGMALSAWIGRHVFEVAISPRLIVLPMTLALMTFVALAGAFPLRLLGRVKPAEILRGE
jgi:putative ABC transport system permease protein